MPWVLFLKYLDEIQNLVALSEHRTLLSDLLAQRHSQEPAYDWSQVDGSLPFREATTAELETALKAIDSQVKAHLEHAIVPMVLDAPDGQWRANGSTARWMSSDIEVADVAAQLGRRMRLMCPAPGGVATLLHDVYAQVTDGLMRFGPCRVPAFDEVWYWATRLSQAVPSIDGTLGCEVIGSRLGSIRADVEDDCLIEITMRDVPVEPTHLRVAKATSPAWPGSPLNGTPLDYAIEFSALHHARPADDYLLLDAAGNVSSTFLGSIVWNVDGEWLTPTSPLRPNPVLDRSVRRGHVHHRPLSEMELDNSSSPVFRVSECAHVSVIASVDGQFRSALTDPSAQLSELRHVLGGTSQGE
jgi:hypothetical protein